MGTGPSPTIVSGARKKFLTSFKIKWKNEHPLTWIIFFHAVFCLFFFFFLMEEGHQQRQKYLGQQKSKWSPGWVPHWKSRPHKTNWSTTWWNSPRSAQLASGPDRMCQLFAHRGFLNAALGKEWGIMEKFLAASKKTQKFFAGMFPRAEEQRLHEQF